MVDPNLKTLEQVIQSLRETAVGVTWWEVKDPDDDTIYFQMSNRETINAESVVRDWLQKCRSEWPSQRFSACEVTSRKVFTSAEQKLLETADLLQRWLDSGTASIGRFVITLDDRSFEVLSDRNLWIEEVLAFPFGVIPVLIQREGE